MKCAVGTSQRHVQANIQKGETYDCVTGVQGRDAAPLAEMLTALWGSLSRLFGLRYSAWISVTLVT